MLFAWELRRPNAVTWGQLIIGPPNYSFDDINTMSFTTHISAQIAEWQKTQHLCHQSCPVRRDVEEGVRRCVRSARADAGAATRPGASGHKGEYSELPYDGQDRMMVKGRIRAPHRRRGMSRRFGRERGEAACSSVRLGHAMIAAPSRASPSAPRHAAYLLKGTKKSSRAEPLSQMCMNKSQDFEGQTAFR